jgi:hypothetical protein
LHNAGAAGGDVAGAADDGGAAGVGGADVAVGLADPVPGAVVVDSACGWLAPQAASVRAAAAAAVDMAIPWKIF